MILAFADESDMFDWLRRNEYYEKRGNMLLGHYEFVTGKEPVVFDNRKEWEDYKCGKVAAQFSIGGISL